MRFTHRHAVDAADHHAAQLSALSGDCVEVANRIALDAGLEGPDARDLVAASEKLQVAMNHLRAVRESNADKVSTIAAAAVSLRQSTKSSRRTIELPKPDLQGVVQPCPQTGALGVDAKKALDHLQKAGVETVKDLWRDGRYDQIGQVASWCQKSVALTPEACAEATSISDRIADDPSVALANDLPFLFDLADESGKEPEGALDHLHIDVSTVLSTGSGLRILRGRQTMSTFSYTVSIYRSLYGLLSVDVRLIGLSPAQRVAVLDHYAKYKNLPRKPRIDCAIRLADTPSAFIVIPETGGRQSLRLIYVRMEGVQTWLAAGGDKAGGRNQLMPETCWATEVLGTNGTSGGRQ